MQYHFSLKRLIVRFLWWQRKSKERRVAKAEKRLLLQENKLAKKISMQERLSSIEARRAKITEFQEKENAKRKQEQAIRNAKMIAASKSAGKLILSGARAVDKWANKK